MATLFVTGMQRSGTTLLDKLLCGHPRVSLLSQPFPLLFVELKRRFLRQLGQAESRYPLGDLFLETRYGGGDLKSFLTGHLLSAADLRTAFEEMAGFSGQYTRFPQVLRERVLADLRPGDLAAVLEQLWQAFAPRPEARWFGAKETIWEEAVPFLLDRGATAVVILRDPRGVLASLNHGEGAVHGGLLKPTLYNVRNWRKSVAFALHLESHPRFLWLRYEDLVTHPRETLGRIADLLGIEPFDAGRLAEGLLDQEGRPWQGNSSYGALKGLDPGAAVRHRAVLPSEVSRYVEATCWPEMRRLGYELDLPWEDVPEVLQSFADPYPHLRPELASYAAGPERTREELRRLEALRGAGPGADARLLFLFEDVWLLLRETVAA